MKIVLFLALITLAAAVAPLLNHGLSSTVPDQYIVILHENSTETLRDSHVQRLTAAGHQVLNVYHIGDFIGFSARITDKDALVGLLEHPDVKYVECDAIVTAFQADNIVQPGATWGLERVCKRDLPKPFTGDYTYWASAGEGVDAYIIDTGILITHVDFLGRAKWGKTFVTGEQDIDCNGHGTHVASTVGGILYGVAKKCNLIAVKVLGCSGSGSWEGVIAGINWVTEQYKANKRPSVANMSLGGGASPTVDAAVTNSIAAGVHFVIAAGNNNANACNYSPARVATAVTVGATTNADARASFSNFGTCVDIFAPGNAITAAWIGTNSAINTISGTSMASPHVAGYVAAFLARNAAGENTPESVKAHLNTVSTKGVVTSPGAGSPNALVFSLA